MTTARLERDVIEKVFQEGILVRVHIGTWTFKSGKIREGEMKANREVISGVKLLIDPNYFRENIHPKERAVRQAAKRFGYDFMGMDSVYYIPKALKNKVDQALERSIKEYNQAVDAFIAEYPKLKDAWRKKDEKLYDETLYPTSAELKETLQVSIVKFSINPPAANLYTPQEFESEKKKLQQQLNNFLDQALSNIATELYGIIKELNSKADKGEGINKKRLETVKGYLEIFEAMNITGNESLNVVAKMMDNLVGSSSKEDWKDPNFNAKIKQETKKFATMLESDKTLKRAIDF